MIHSAIVIPWAKHVFGPSGLPDGLYGIFGPFRTTRWQTARCSVLRCSAFREEELICFNANCRDSQMLTDPFAADLWMTIHIN